MADSDDVSGSAALLGGGNQLLAQTSADDLVHLLKSGARKSFNREDLLCAANTVSNTAYFIEDGVASVVKPEIDGRQTEICLVGPESFVGSAIIQADGQSPYETFVQADRLISFCVDASSLRLLWEQSTSFRATLGRAMHLQTVQIAENLVCAATRPTLARLARWLLMYRDRVRSPHLEVTHKFMAIMVAAERAKITSALHSLEGAGAISATRGRVTIRDAAKLRLIAEGAYGCAEQESARLRTRA